MRVIGIVGILLIVLGIVGILLIVLGIVGLVFHGVTYTKRETIIDLGPVKATKDTQTTISLSPILGGLTLAAGVVLLIASARGK